MSILFFNSCVCVSECSRQRDIHGTSISSLMYCKYYLFCAAYININIWVSEYPTHSSGPWQQAWATQPVLDFGSGSNMRYLQSPDCAEGWRHKKVLHFASGGDKMFRLSIKRARFLARWRCGLDYPPFFLSGMIDSVIKSVYCYSKHQSRVRLASRECCTLSGDLRVSLPSNN